MRIENFSQKIYPKEAHPLTKALLVVGLVFVIIVFSFVVVLAFRIGAKSLRQYALLTQIANAPISTTTSTTTTAMEQQNTATTSEEKSKNLETTTTTSLSPEKIKPGFPETNIYPIGAPGPSILPDGTPDLAVKIIDTGIIRDTDGVFVSATSTELGQQTGIVFDIINVGTAISGSWRFDAILPTYAGNFNSEIQQSLAPGEKIRFTIGFRVLNNKGLNTVTIIVDPQNEIKDSNRQNNSTSTVIIRDY